MSSWSSICSTSDEAVDIEDLEICLVFGPHSGCLCAFYRASVFGRDGHDVLQASDLNAKLGLYMSLASQPGGGRM